MLGSKIWIKSIEIRGRYELAEGASGAMATGVFSNIIRMALILDTQNNGTGAIWSDVYEQNDYRAFRNIGNGNRFRILKEWLWNIESPALLIVGANIENPEISRKIKYYKKCNILVDFSNQAGGSRAIRS